MTEFIYGYDEEYETFNRKHKNGTVFQSYLWSGAKPSWRWTGVKIRRGGVLKGIMGVLIRPVPFTGYTLMYAPRGPVFDENDISTLSELTAAAETIARKERAYVFKADTDIAYGSTGFRDAMLSLGYRLLPESLDFDNIQPQFVARLYLNGRTEQEVMASFKNKTRYNIRLAQRKGVEVKVCGKEALDEFYPIMQVTGQRDGFIIRSLEYFRTMFDALGDNVRLYMAYCDGTAAAGAICANYGRKTWYQYGASSNEYRDRMPNYLLQWEMIRWAIQMGSDVYDFRGVSGNLDENSPHYGLWRFKRGFAAQMVKLAGEFEYVYHPVVYKFMQIYIPVGRKISRMLSDINKKIKKSE